MNLYLLFIAIISLIGIKIHIRDINADFLSKECTSCINGIFILIVFYSHLVNDYIPVNDAKDGLMFALKHFLGQLMVTPFLFYSGYALFVQTEKREDYIRLMPRKRILKVWLHFAFAVALFAVVQLFLGNTYSAKRYIFSLLAWESIGNSNWYIFDILCLYVMTYVCFSVCKDRKNAIFLFAAQVALFMLFMAKHRQEYWFNTTLCYPAGMIVAYNREKLTEILSDSGKYLLVLLSALAAFLILNYYKRTNYWFYSIYAVVFTLLVLLITVKVEIRSPALNWIGDRLFWVYILQRIPMMVLKHFGYASSHAYRTALISLTVTMVLALAFDKFFRKTDSVLFR